MQATTALENAAILLSFLPAVEAEQVLRRMPSAEAMAIRDRVNRCQNSPSTRLATARQFMCEMSGGARGSAYLRVDAAQSIPSFHFLARLLPSRVADVLQHEMPRTTAAILSMLPASRAADVMALLPEDYQSEVVHQMLCGSPIGNDVLCELARSLADVLAGACGNEPAQPNGRSHLIALLQCADEQSRQRWADIARRDGVELHDGIH